MQRSRDLHVWEFLPPVFSARFKWIVDEVPGAESDLWAPDISFHDGVWYLYYAASSFGTNASVIGLATNVALDPARPDFKWVDRGEVIRSTPGRDDWNAIDPSLVVDASGKWFLVFGSFWSGIKLVELDSRTGKPAEGSPVLTSLAARPEVKNHPIEAAFISEHGSFWYLWVSYDYCCRALQSDYKIAVGRSASVNGPYVDRDGRPMMQGGGTIVLKTYDDVHGPGGCTVLHDGDRDLLVHHMYDGKRYGASVLQVRPIRWEDGWPVIGDPL
jgi:arabinan endo-1,5-alpha-L-arabinosidase